MTQNIDETLTSIYIELPESFFHLHLDLIFMKEKIMIYYR